MPIGKIKEKLLILLTKLSCLPFRSCFQNLDSLNAHFMWARLLDRAALALHDTGPDHAPKPAFKAAFTLVNEAIVTPTASVVTAVHGICATVTDVVRTRQAMVVTRDLEEMYAVCGVEPMMGTTAGKNAKGPVVRVRVTFYNNLV